MSAPISLDRVDPGDVLACCSAVYGHPIAELLIGPSLHPGGTAATRRLLRDASLPRRARLLDAGCGLGASARIAAGELDFDVDAVDASPTVIERARARDGAGGITWQQADIMALPFEARRFDAVLAECVLSVASSRQAMAELRRVLASDGSLLVSDVERTGTPIKGIDDDSVLGAALCIAGAWLPGELDDVAARHGLVVQRRWQRSDDILDLLERIEGRLRIAASVAAGLGSGLEDVVDGDLGLERARALIDTVRDAVQAGELGYFAAHLTASQGRRAGMA